MSELKYKIVPHDGGWAYKADGAFSEPFPTHEEALEAAKAAAQRQRIPDETDVIKYEDEKGKWHIESDRGHDRPSTSVEDEQ